MIKVGITGGMGSGKSTVCRKFSELGIPIFDSDSSAKSHYKDWDVKHILFNLFGRKVLKDYELDTKELAKIVFADATKLELLSKVLQPYVLDDFNEFCIKHKNSPYCIFESAIIYERKLAKIFDKIIIVVADKETRLARVMLRNNAPMEEIIPVMNSQLSDEGLKAKKHDFIINNDGRQDIIQQILDIHNQIIDERAK